MLTVKKLLESRRVPHAKPRPKDVMAESRMGGSRQPRIGDYEWTLKKVRVVKELARVGTCENEIARYLNVAFGGDASAQTVNECLLELEAEPEKSKFRHLYRRRPGLKLRAQRYEWTPQKVRMLERLAGRGMSNEDIAAKLNERFGGEATAKTVISRLSVDVYRRRPELKRIYEWTPKKVKMLERLAGRGMSNEDIAAKLNERFGGEATVQTVKSKLSLDVYRRRPELKRREQYRWTPEKVKFLEDSVQEGLVDAQIAVKLNERFGGEATAQIVNSKLVFDVYRRRPELKRKEMYEWTPKKVKMLERLAGRGMSNEDIAAKLNERFGGEASAQTVDSKLTRDVYRRRPELKRG
jgi:hypothetical protein